MEEKNLKAEESLRIIEQMIQKTKGNLHDSSFYFLLWGWIILIANIGQIVLNYLSYDKPYLVWLLIIPGVIASAVYGAQHGRKAKVETHLDRLNFLIWMAFLVCYFTILIFMKEINYQVIPVIFLLAGYATFLTGVVIKFKPLIWGGFIFLAGVFAYFLLPANYFEFVPPVVIILGYLIPGYLLKTHHKKNA
ncbi:MAG: hypothetical protein SVU94_11525 [Bacteroidota bacterium]|nr:hypothetical protein [Bacteroidota bacterium]